MTVKYHKSKSVKLLQQAVEFRNYIRLTLMEPEDLKICHLIVN